MIKIENSRHTGFSYEKTRLSNCQSKSRFSVQRPSVYLQGLKPLLKKSISQKVRVLSRNYDKVKDTLEWRKKTQFPIVKIKNWKSVQRVSYEKDFYIDIRIELESSFKCLKQIQSLSLIQALYILKESLVGFDRLCYRFGKFRPTNSMIFFDSNGYCKVWMNQNLFENFSQPQSLKSEKDFLKILCSLIKDKTSKSKKCLTFFEDIQSCNCFFEAIATLRKFIKENNMQIPCSLKLSSFQNQNFEKRRNRQKSILKQKSSNHNGQLYKIPTFLKSPTSHKIIQQKNLSFQIKSQKTMPWLKNNLYSQKNLSESSKQIHKDNKKSVFSKSPSHKVISISKAIIQEHQIDESICLRETLKVKSAFKFDMHEICFEKDGDKQSFNTTEESFSVKPKRKNFKKLFEMGRFISQSEQTIKCEFELEYGQKIVEQQFIRNQFTNLLS